MPRASNVVLSITAVAVALAVQPVQAQEATSAAASSDPAALAVLPIAEADRATAKILGYEDGALVVLREGTGAFICIADNPDDERFQVLCYHKSLEPYMARGRELRAEGITGKPGIEKRWAVTLENADSLGRLTVIYMAYATVEETGLLGQPSRGKPWIMYPGKPTAHVMISGR